MEGPAAQGTCQGQLWIPDCEGAYSTLLLMHLDQLQSLQDGTAALERRMGELFSQVDSTLTSITGIGPVLGAVILSEIRDISCFSFVPRILCALMGMSFEPMLAHPATNGPKRRFGFWMCWVVLRGRRDTNRLTGSYTAVCAARLDLATSSSSFRSCLW